MEPHDFPKTEAPDFSKTESPVFAKTEAHDLLKVTTEPHDFSKVEGREFFKTESHDYFEARGLSRTEGHDFPKKEKSEGTSSTFASTESTLTESHDYFEARELSQTEGKEISQGTSSTFASTESIFLKANAKFLCKREKDDISSIETKSNRYLWMSLMRIRDFISLLLSYPVRIIHDGQFKDWINDISNWYNLMKQLNVNAVYDARPLRYVEGLVPTEILRDVQKGERSIFNDDVMPEAILNLATDLAVDQLIQTLLFKHHHAHSIKYVRLSTRSNNEKRAVKEKIEAALKDMQNKLEPQNAFHRTLMIDASTYQSSVENQVRQDVYQLLQLPLITEYATEDNDISRTRLVEEEMSSKRYLVLLVSGDAEEMLHPRKVGFSKTNLSGVVVLITSESSMQEQDELITELDLEIRTEDHLLPWKVFCHNVGSEVVFSSCAIQTIAVRIVEECRGHLLAITLVAKWLKNLQDVKLWELALHKLRYTNPSYDIHNFHDLSTVMVNTFLNLIWDEINETQKHCLVHCLFIPEIKDGKGDYELMNDWISSLLVDAEEAEHNLRRLIDRSVLTQFEVTGGRNIRLPEETYEIIQSLCNLNPLFIKKAGLGLTEPPNTEPWHSAIQIELANNKLSELPLSPNWLELTVLMLQGNADLTKIPPLFFVNMPLLRILDLSYTSIRELPASFFNLEQLRELYLKGCECFMKLPPEIGKLHKLEKLDLDETQIINLPKEIQELANMRTLILNFYEYRGKKNKSYSCSTIIPSGVISKLKRLKHLSIDVNPDDERWHQNIQVILPEVSGLECLQTLSLYVPQLELLKLLPAHIFEVDFRFIVGCHLQRIISSIPPTVNLNFRQNDCSLKFVKGADVPREIKILLRHSKALFLDRHMTIKNLSEFEMMNLEQLQVCILAECKEMQTIVDGRHSNSNNDMLSQLLFLSVYHMKNLRSIWEGPTPPHCFFGMLKSLVLQSCPKLETLFSLDFLGYLSLLRELIIKDCPKLSTLINHESSELKVNIFLPKLSKLSLVHLPKLISISNGLHIGPDLKEIGFYNCPNLQSLSWKELSSQKLTVIKGETNWWKALKWRYGEWGLAGRPPKFNWIFSPINEEADVMTQLGIYDDDDIDDSPGDSVGEPSRPTAFATPMLKSPSDRGFQVQKQNIYRQIKYFPMGPTEISHPLDLEDGYKWKIYDSKLIPNMKYPRNYFRCVERSDQRCLAIKQVQRSNEDPPTYKTAYMGMHTCKPIQSSIVTSIDDSVNSQGIPLLSSYDSVATHAATKEVDDWSKKNYSTKRTVMVPAPAPQFGNIEIPLDDGFSWRKYGQKDILGSKYPRGYYRCTHRKLYGCPARRQVQRRDDNPSIFEVTYRGLHTCHMSSIAPSSPPPPKPLDLFEDMTQSTISAQSKKNYSTKRTVMVPAPAPQFGNIEIPLDDGFSWRKYAQKEMLGSKYPRGYYRCTHRYLYGCLAIKKVQQRDDNPSIFEVTYRGLHTCHMSSIASSSPPPPKPLDLFEDMTPSTISPQSKKNDPDMRITMVPAPRCGNTEIPPEDGFTRRKYGQKEIGNE